MRCKSATDQNFLAEIERELRKGFVGTIGEGVC
jgi:hypothetical protein